MKTKRELVLGTAAFILAAIAPSVALADDTGYYEVNNGDGTCATESCGENGCIVVDVHPCPKEVGDG
jgi:hypothetical protein